MAVVVSVGHLPRLRHGMLKGTSKKKDDLSDIIMGWGTVSCDHNRTAAGGCELEGLLCMGINPE